uniref:Uncharacterized protein n=1 Tax=Romanomermis culicivorax TaxID=13658 RepID=A0A915KTJ3_ROMCU
MKDYDDQKNFADFSYCIFYFRVAIIPHSSLGSAPGDLCVVDTGVLDTRTRGFSTMQIRLNVQNINILLSYYYIIVRERDETTRFFPFLFLIGYCTYTEKNTVINVNNDKNEPRVNPICKLAGYSKPTSIIFCN